MTAAREWVKGNREITVMIDSAHSEIQIVWDNTL